MCKYSFVQQNKTMNTFIATEQNKVHNTITPYELTAVMNGLKSSSPGHDDTPVSAYKNIVGGNNVRLLLIILIG